MNSAIVRRVRGCSAEQRLAARKARAAPLMQSLWRPDTATDENTVASLRYGKSVLAYLLKQWDALNVYCSNGWVEIDNNIAENVPYGSGRRPEKPMFLAVPTAVVNMRRCCTLADRHMPSEQCEPEKGCVYVIEHIQDWPANRYAILLPWKVDLVSANINGSDESHYKTEDDHSHYSHLSHGFFYLHIRRYTHVIKCLHACSHTLISHTLSIQPG
ncbi:transposase [Escherichia coli]|uniref:IS66 family transposase n=1 Tax=Escherichia coli TaxID=562 RepID=UPI00263A5711|nr:transposase [Escherichia coli]WKB91777.1 transposase [Escherichia coli]